MALDKFKYYKIRLDRIDMSITTPLTAKEGAVNGNGIELQLVNGSIIEDTTGVAVYLNWKHRTTGVQGSEPFTLADAATGLYRVSYPTEMLTGGLVDADIKVVDGTSIAVSTSPILIKVAEAVTDSTTQSENAWNDIQTILVSQQQLKALFEQAIAGVTVDSEVITARQSTVKGITYPTLDGRLEDIEEHAGVMATNLVTNGDFSNGTTGWTGVGGVLSNNANTGIVTGNGTNQSISIREDRVSTILQNGRKEYARVRMRVRDNQSQYIRMRLYAGLSDTTINTPVQDQWYEVSAIMTGNSTTEANTYVRFLPSAQYVDAATANGKKFEIERPLIIDLTAIFGAGKEPTKEQMDWLLAQKFTNSWFDGTKELTSITDLLTLVNNTKADKTQEAWITPTLLNSWVAFDVESTLKYRKDSIGKVTISGKIKSGANGTDAFVLPSGYRPLHILNIPIDSNGAFARAIVRTNGYVYISTTNNTSVALENISFFTDI